MAETIHAAIQEENVTVRIKASWSLGNLSDALVLRKGDSNAFEEIPDNLLLDLIEISVKKTSENVKIRINTVRAMGNFLQLMTEDMLKDQRFQKICEDAIRTLRHNCINNVNVKVGCYCLRKLSCVSTGTNSF